MRIGIILLWCIHTSLSAQVNTEAMRKYNAQRGFHNSAGLTATLLGGNSEASSISGNYRLDWLTKNYYSFGTVNYQRGESNGKLFSKKGFVHIRTARNLTEEFILEAFVQKEFNDFLRLKDRTLEGGGLRYEIFQTDTMARRARLIFAVGVGGMWEDELLKDQAGRTRQIRSTNYASIRYQPSDQIAVVSIGYYQASIKRRGDYRALNQSMLTLAITKAISFNSTFNFRYDHEPPRGVKKSDRELIQGIQVNF